MSEDARKRIRSVAALGGSGMAAYGLWLLSPPAALVAGGLVVAVCAVLSHIQDVKRKLNQGERDGI